MNDLTLMRCANSSKASLLSRLAFSRRNGTEEQTLVLIRVEDGQMMNSKLSTSSVLPVEYVRNRPIA